MDKEENKLIEEYIINKYKTEYATYCIYDENNNLINPDNIFIEGNVFLYEKPDGFFTDKGYCSKIINNPTYGDILLLTDDMIKHTEDTDHRFLEDINIIKKVDNNTYQLSVDLGS